MLLSRNTVERLESLAADTYLSLIQDAAYIYVQLTRIDSAFLRNVRQSILPMLKDQLKPLSGTQSSSIRQDLVNKIISGKYPTKNRFRNQYQPIKPEDIDSSISEMKRHGSKCK